MLNFIHTSIQRYVVQAIALAALVPQERARWLNLANLSDREKEDILDMPIVLEETFGSALASMQQCYEAKKKEGEALQLCLPQKSLAPPQLVRRKDFTPVGTQAPLAGRSNADGRGLNVRPTCMSPSVHTQFIR